MPGKDEQADLFRGETLEFELDGVVVPDDHSVFKLFPGKTYRLAKAMYEAKHAFLDIEGLSLLPGSPSEWTDDDLLRVISLDRIMRDGSAAKPGKRKRRGSDQDKKRLGFLKNLFFTAKKGDLILVPLGEGYAGQIAVGELLDDAGDLRGVQFASNDKEFSTYGRRVSWITKVWRNQLSPELTASIHSPTAFHLISASSFEEVYTATYGTFTYKGIYVAKFTSEKEVFSPQDYAGFGALFNGISVIHDRPNVVGSFYEIAFRESGNALIELRRNSPISVFLRTIGPLAFSAAVIYSGAAEGKSIDQLQHVEVTARKIGHADDRCKVDVPRDVANTSVGFGVERYQTFCAARTKVEKEATVHSPAHLKSARRKRT